MGYDWDFAFLVSPVKNGDETYLDWLLQGLFWTLCVALSAWLIALAIGIVVGSARTLRSCWVAALAEAWVELLRNVPLLVQLLLGYFVVPELLPRELGLWVKQDMPPALTAIICLGLYTSARIAEQTRAGIEGLPAGQRQAALALGLTTTACYVIVLLPQALRRIMPTLTSEFMNIIKNSSVAFAIGVLELTFQARQMQEDSEHGLETYLVVTLLYVACAFAANRGMAWIERRTRIPGYLGSAR